jgi:hypothetical protein
LSSNTGFACLRCKNARQKFILLQAGACEYAPFNDGEMSGPIGPFNNPGGKTGCRPPLRAALATGAIQCQKMLAGLHAKQVHQSPYRKSARCVFLAAHASSSSSLIPGAATRTQNNVMAGCFQLSHGIARKIFVCEEAHLYAALGYSRSLTS